MHSSFVVPKPHEMSWGAEGIPRDVEPAGGSKELVGIFTSLEEGDEVLELGGVLGADVDGLSKKVLGVGDATNKGVDTGVAEARVDNDGAHLATGRLQQQVAAVGHVGDGLHRGDVVGILAQLAEL